MLATLPIGVTSHYTIINWLLSTYIYVQSPLYLDVEVEMRIMSDIAADLHCTAAVEMDTEGP